ncbi:glycosyltransferase family 2 protein [Psychrobacillus sp. NPDC096623]|uniref:glycosyltransferase family 2 protein n=1 Tax=Psychrobacillus sp. NPDC096623 TaxID=3364492 RepID=UPI003822B6FF
MELVSVLLPVFNVDKYIEETVNSILKQTYTNIEIIIVDDSSTDNTYSIVQKLQKSDGRIKLYKNRKNLQIAKTLNIAYQHSNGDYICRMDGDDVSHLERIERKLNYLRSNPEISLVGCSVKSINETGDLLGCKKMLSNQVTIHKTLKYASPVFHIWLARREVYEKLKGYRHIPYVEDYDFLLRMTSLGYKYTNISEYFGYSIRLRSGNTISTAGILQRKAHRYCYNLYQRRCQGYEENFSIGDFNDYVRTTSLEFKMFKKSNILLQKALFIKKRMSFRKIMYAFLSYLISKEQRKYINGRLIVLYLGKSNSVE